MNVKNPSEDTMIEINLSLTQCTFTVNENNLTSIAGDDDETIEELFEIERILRKAYEEAAFKYKKILQRTFPVEERTIEITTEGSIWSLND